MKLNLSFQRSGRSQTQSLPWGKYGYFLELYIVNLYNFFL